MSFDFLKNNFYFLVGDWEKEIGEFAVIYEGKKYLVVGLVFILDIVVSTAPKPNNHFGSRHVIIGNTLSLQGELRTGVSVRPEFIGATQIQIDQFIKLAKINSQLQGNDGCCDDWRGLMMTWPKDSTALSRP